MSSLLLLSRPRLEKALTKYLRSSHPNNWEMEGPAFTARQLQEALLRRGARERDIHSLFGDLIRYLEPEPCPMTHCEFFGGAGAPMNCQQERVPGRCGILKAFRERKRAREEQAQEANATGGEQKGGE